MQVCTSLQTDNHASTPPLSFFTGQMQFLPPNQQRQNTEGVAVVGIIRHASFMRHLKKICGPRKQQHMQRKYDTELLETN